MTGRLDTARPLPFAALFFLLNIFLAPLCHAEDGPPVKIGPMAALSGSFSAAMREIPLADGPIPMVKREAHFTLRPYTFREGRIAPL